MPDNVCVEILCTLTTYAVAAERPQCSNRPAPRPRHKPQMVGSESVAQLVWLCVWVGGGQVLWCYDVDVHRASDSTQLPRVKAGHHSQRTTAYSLHPHRSTSSFVRLHVPTRHEYSSTTVDTVMVERGRIEVKDEGKKKWKKLA